MAADFVLYNFLPPCSCTLLAQQLRILLNISASFPAWSKTIIFIIIFQDHHFHHYCPRPSYLPFQDHHLFDFSKTIIFCNVAHHLFLWLSVFSQRGGGGILCLDGPGLRWKAQLWGVHGRGAADPIITIISNIEIITNIAKVTFIINTKGPQFLGIFCVFGLTLESLFYNLSIFSEIQIVLWSHFPSTASFHLWVCTGCHSSSSFRYMLSLLVNKQCHQVRKR